MLRNSWIRLIVVNAVLTFVLCEAASLVWLYARERTFYYRRAPLPVPVRWRPKGPNGELTALRLHPYLGYRYVGEGVNNQGFEDAHDYPFRPGPRQYVVGVFGGSLAHYLASYEARSHVLARRLQRVPQLADKEVVVLSMAARAYKQPQALLTLSYLMSLGQHFDAVLNLDGFNEVALANLNRRAGVAVGMPDVKLMLPLLHFAGRNLTVAEIEALYASVTTRSRAVAAFERAESSPLALGNVLWKTYARWCWRHRLRDEARLEELLTVDGDSGAGDESIAPLDRLSPAEVAPAVAYESMVSLWSEASLLMRDICQGEGVVYFHALQPNQYFKTARVFSAAERKRALAPEGRYSRAAETGYPLLVGKLKELQRRGLNTLDATAVFDREAAPVYSDDCCHLTPRGEQILSERLAQWMAETLERQGTADAR